jgi:hypothetical protein
MATPNLHGNRSAFSCFAHWRDAPGPPLRFEFDTGNTTRAG